MANKVTVAEYIELQIKASDKSQKQIAEEAGFRHPNILAMIKGGDTKLPIQRVNALADSLGVQRAKLMRMVLDEYQPEVLEAIEASLGEIKVKD